VIARIVDWLLTLIPHKVRATNDGYWGGVFTHALDMLRHAGAKATAFLRR
jgi:peptidoglycan/xylan/chitin deacetylase (PgdA/CDA1 family)